MIDSRAEETIKLISRSTSQTFSKTLRKRLPRVILNGPKVQQSQLIPYYLRFTAIVSQYFPDIAAEVCRLTELEFKEFQESSIMDRLDLKLKNIRFLGELTKFNLV